MRDSLFSQKNLQIKCVNPGIIFGPFGVIVGHFGSFLGHFGSFWVILGPFSAILGHLGSYLGHFGQFWVILGHFWAICSCDSCETLKYGTFGRKKFGFRAMSRRILKLCVASLLNILCFPEACYVNFYGLFYVS